MKTRLRKLRNLNRNILQLSIIGLLVYMLIRFFFNKNYFPDFEAYCPFGGMQAFSSLILNNSLTCSMTAVQIFMGLALLIGVVIFSKLFCSFICPIGTVTEWLGVIGDKLKMRYTIKGLADKALRALKYILLFLTFYFTLSSSELFCKKYDPFYASFNGFSLDTNLYYAIITLGIVIFGSVFIRQFWCKYVCPLSAVSNIFSYYTLFLSTVFVFLIVIELDIKVDWVYLLIALCSLGFLAKTFFQRVTFFPLFRVTRQACTCTNCKMCDKVCPMAIKVSEMSKVKHIDCHLCADCVEVCPEKNTLQINKRNMKWLPALATVILISFGIYASKTIEIPTVNLWWGDKNMTSKAEVFKQENLKSIKCFGSASSFAAKMQEVPGVLGVEAYAGSHSAKIYYDASLTNPKKIKKAMFTPLWNIFKIPDSNGKQLQASTFYIERFFDVNDAYYITELLSNAGGIYAIETVYGEPVQAIIYFDPAKTSTDKIKNIIESKELTYTMDSVKTTVDLEFAVSKIAPEIKKLTALDFEKKVFEPFDEKFNSFDKYDSTAFSIFEISISDVRYNENKKWYPYLGSHLSNDDGIVRLKIEYNKTEPVARIFYSSKLTDEKKILRLIKSKKFSVHYEDGRTKEFENPFQFKL